jgi:ornithine carbamoyltransferase
LRLGGRAQFLGPAEIDLGKREPYNAVLRMAQANGLARIEVVASPAVGATDADVIYADAWASTGQKPPARPKCHPAQTGR